MKLILKFKNNGINWQFGNLQKRQLPEINMGLIVDLGENAISGFLSNSGSLISVKYPQSDKSKFISFYLDNKILSIPLTITGANEEVLDIAKTSLDSVINKNDITEFEVDKYIDINGKETLRGSYRFFGIFKKMIYTEFGNEGYNLLVEIEMTEPRFDKINRDTNNNIIPNSISKIIKQQGLKFPIKFPVKFGGETNKLTIINKGNATVTPNIELKNAGSGWKIITNKGLFFYSQTLVRGQVLFLDVENQSATLNGFEKNVYCTGWENLVLEVGENTWNIQAQNTQSDTEITVKYFEKYHSL